MTVINFQYLATSPGDVRKQRVQEIILLRGEIFQLQVQFTREWED